MDIKTEKDIFTPSPDQGYINRPNHHPGDCHVDVKMEYACADEEAVTSPTTGEGDIDKRNLDADDFHLEVKTERTCTDVKASNYASALHSIQSESNGSQINEAYPCDVTDVKVKNELLYNAEPLTLNLEERKDLDTSETSKNFQNDQVSCEEEEDIFESPYVTDIDEEEEWKVDNRKNKKRKVSCKVCKDTFDSSYKLYRHMSSHKSTCVVCDIGFVWKYVYEGHMREHAGEQTPYWCDLCDRKFQNKTGVQTHRALHAKKGKFDCSICGACFSRRDNYEAHMKLHADPEKNKCEVCGKQFACLPNLRKHMAVHQDKKPYHCIVCDKGFSYLNTWKYHMKSHTAQEHNKPYKCDTCNLSFGCKGGYTNHMNIHTGAKPFACGVCGMRFAQQSSKQGHELTHKYPSKKQITIQTEEQRAQNISLSHDCDQCFLSFTRQIYLDQHIQKSHVSQTDMGASSKPEIYICGVCGKSFGDTRKLNNHLIECHVQKNIDVLCNGKRQSLKESTMDKNHATTVFKCKICEKNVAKGTLGHHMRNHGEKKFVCRVCGLKFHQTGNMSRHMRLHTGETPFKCTTCDQKFRTSDNLKRHRCEHVEGHKKQSRLEKKYECEKCGKKFLDNYHLNRHSVIHMKKYRCNVCKQRFIDIELFEKHKLTHQG